MRKIWIGSLLAIAVILFLPAVLTVYGTKLSSELFVMSIFALSLGLIMGYAGLASFGHASFFGLGVYTVALLGGYVENTYFLILAAMVVAGLLAWVTGLIFIRSSGVYFFILTLAFNQLLFVTFYKMKGVTGGADGLSIRVSPDFGFGAITKPASVYYFMAICFLLCMLIAYVYVNSPTGKIVYGVKENESRMKALGYNITYYKVLTYTLSGMMAGFAGALYGYLNSFASPESIHWALSGQVLTMVIIGGVGTLIGPPIGAAVFVILQSYISSYTDRWPIVMGLIFITIVLYGRGGIAHFLAFFWHKITSMFQRDVKVNESSEGYALPSTAQIAENEELGGR